MNIEPTAIATIEILLHDSDISPQIFENALLRWSYPWKVTAWRMFGNTVEANVAVTDAIGYTRDGIAIIIGNALKNKNIQYRNVAVTKIKHQPMGE